MRLRVRECERRAPRAAEDEPALDAEMLAQPLHVGDQVPGRVVDEARVRATATAPALIEQHDAVGGRIEEAARPVVAAGARPAMHEHCGLAARVAAFLVVNLVHIGYAQITGRVRLDGRVQRFRPGAHARAALARAEDSVPRVIALLAGGY